MSSKSKRPVRPRVINASPSTNGHAINGVPGGPRMLTANERRWNEYRDLVTNLTSMRRDWLQNLLDPRRNVEKECGYPTGQVAVNVYQQLFDREPIANRVVQILPRETWQVQPLLYEDESPDVVTPFERAWDDLARQLRGGSMYQDESGNPVWEYLLRADVLSGIGQFAVILLGIDDGLRLDQPAEGVTDGRDDPKKEKRPDNPSNQGLTVSKPEKSSPFGVSPYSSFQDTLYSQTSLAPPRSKSTNDGPDLGFEEAGDGPEETSSPIRSDAERDKDDPSVTPLPSESDGEGDKRRLLFLRVFPESLVTISRWNSDPTSPRFGYPEQYRITLSDPTKFSTGIGQPSMTVDVHWSRVIHVADNLTSSETLGTPRMQPVLNRLIDLQKICGAAGEGYWKQAFSTLVLESNPQLGGDVDVDREDLRDQLENLDGGLQRSLVLMGMQAKTLPPGITDPTPFVNVMIEQICVQIGVPVRVFKGSERGELASSQDDAAWNDRLRARQTYYVTPRIIIPFVDRLIAMGVLPKPKTGKKSLGALGAAKREGDVKAKPPGGAPPAPGEDGGDEGGGGKPSFPPFSKQKAAGAGGPPKFNAFCPTGDGGGIDNSCSPKNVASVVPLKTYSPPPNDSLVDRNSADGELKRAMITQYGGRGSVPMFHEAPISSLDSIRENGLTSGHSAEDTNFATVGKPSEFVTAEDKVIVRFNVPISKIDRLTPDMRYDPDNPSRDVLQQHKGSFGADFAYDGPVPLSMIDKIIVVRGNKVESVESEPVGSSRPQGESKPSFKKPGKGIGWMRRELGFNALPFDPEEGSPDEDFEDEGTDVDNLFAQEGDGEESDIEGSPGEEEAINDAPGYSVEWPDIDSMTDLERAQVFNQRVAAWAAYVQGGVDQLISPEFAMTHLDQFDDEEAMAILAEGIKRQEETLAREAEQMAEFGFKPDPQNPGAMIDPEQQEAENEIELAKAENPAGVQQSGPPSPFGAKPGAGGPPGAKKPPPFAKNEATENVFCPTGPGGGQDNSCGREGDASAIHDYTEESDDVNIPLREGGVESLTGRSKEIFDRIQPLAQQKLPEPTTVYRGVQLPGDLEDRLVAGATVKFDGLTSTSTDIEEAKVFGRRGVMLKIKAKTGVVVGSDAAKYSAGQKEIIQAHGTSYRVVKEHEHDLKGHRRLIELEEI